MILGWAIFVMYFTPTRIVEFVGIHNGYLISALFSFLGGTSILVPFPYYLIVMTFGAGGLNPFFLGICAGLGLIIGDATTYLIGYSGREIVPTKLGKLLEKFCTWCTSKPGWLVSIILIIYGTMPLPNDLIMIPMGLARYPFWRVAAPLAIGNIIFNTLIAFAGFYGWNLLFIN